MKKSLLFILILVGVSFAQEVSVVSIEQITKLEQGEFFYPVVSNNDSKILFSSEDYRGLWMFDNNSQSIEKINDYINAGYEPMFTDEGSIVYRKDNFKNNLRFISILEYSLFEKKETVIENELRNIAQIKVVNGNEINYSLNQELLEIKSTDGLLKTASNDLPTVMIENSNLVLYKNGEREVLNPMGDGNYLWASVSPDGNRLLFTFAGEGSFVTNLSGEILNELGYAHYPQWSKDGTFISYMKDYDDGEKVIKSDLFVYSTATKTETKITDTKDIHEMYPTWSKLKNDVYCNSTEGIIYKIELKFN
jgi:Tol biopolymer transport system component